jgi:hypothetical protein
VVPWMPVILIALGCLLTALLASVAPAAISLRRRPAELARAPGGPGRAPPPGAMGPGTGSIEGGRWGGVAPAAGGGPGAPPRDARGPRRQQLA